jgi:hypothetical protein
MPKPRVTFFRGREMVNVAGESHYQDALRAIAGPGEVRLATEAQLVPEPENEYDPNAVRVEVDGRKVGYLPRDLAPAWAPRLAELAARRRVGGCEATIVGGAETALGVFLRLPPASGDPGVEWDLSRRF